MRASRWGIPVTWLEYKRKGKTNSYQVVSHNSASQEGEPFEELLTAKRYLPNAVAQLLHGRPENPSHEKISHVSRVGAMDSLRRHPRR